MLNAVISFLKLSFDNRLMEAALGSLGVGYMMLNSRPGLDIRLKYLGISGAQYNVTGFISTFHTMKITTNSPKSCFLSTGELGH